MLLEKNFNKSRKIDVVPMLSPDIMSLVNPIKNNSVLEGFILNLIINKYKIIEIRLGVTVSNNERKLNDF